jgi:hypothetical protein
VPSLPPDMGCKPNKKPSMSPDGVAIETDCAANWRPTGREARCASRDGRKEAARWREERTKSRLCFESSGAFKGVLPRQQGARRKALQLGAHELCGGCPHVLGLAHSYARRLAFLTGPTG